MAIRFIDNKTRHGINAVQRRMDAYESKINEKFGNAIGSTVRNTLERFFPDLNVAHSLFTSLVTIADNVNDRKLFFDASSTIIDFEGSPKAAITVARLMSQDSRLNLGRGRPILNYFEIVRGTYEKSRSHARERLSETMKCLSIPEVASRLKKYAEMHTQAELFNISRVLVSNYSDGLAAVQAARRQA